MLKRQRATVLAALLALPGSAWAQDDGPRAWNAPEDAADDASGDAAEDAPVERRIAPHRYTYAGAGLFLVGGLGMSYWAQGQTLRAGSITSARDHARIMGTARTSAATANMLYVMAGLTLAYGLALEFLPEPVAQKAELTFHF